jgi:phenylacetate-CoA ligase
MTLRRHCLTGWTRKKPRELAQQPMQCYLPPWIPPDTTGKIKRMSTTQEQFLENDALARLEEALPEWLNRIPMYQGPAYAVARNNGGMPFEKRLASLPFIKKSVLRHGFPGNFLGADGNLEDLISQRQVELEYTSGTSEERTKLLLPYGWWDKQELAALKQNPFVAEILEGNPEARRVTVNSPVCNNDISYATVPTRNERIVRNSLFLSLSRFPFLWDEAELSRMVAETLEWEPVFLDVDPVYGMIFARHCLRRGVRLPSLRFIISSYSFSSVNHRRIMEQALGVPVLNLYGSTETGHLLMEDGAGSMTPSPETAFLEVIGTNPKGVGELVVSTLTNNFMPLIRFRIGDFVRKTVRSGRALYEVHGRVKDAFHTAGGETVTVRDVDECFAGFEGVAHYHLLQTETAHWNLRYVAEDKAPDAKTLKNLGERLGGILGAPGAVTMEQTDLVLPEGSGKFRLCQPLVKPAESD